MSTPTRKDYILWGALGCALVATYHAEYTLAVAAGFHPYVALAVPGALDLYVIRALQQRRDVLVAVLAMVAANVASHLIAKDVLQVGWQVIAAVGAIAPLVLWRVYSLKHTRNRQELLHGVQAGAVECSECGEILPDHVRDCVRWVQAGALEYTGEVSAPDGYPAAPTPTPYTYDARTGQPTSWTPAPDRIPDWMDREYPVSAPPTVTGVQMTPEEYTEYERVWPSVAAEVGTSTPPLPALPPEYPALTEDEWDELTQSDREYLGELNEYIHSTESHTLAGLRAALGVGQARGQRLIKHARKEGVW